MSDHFPTVSQRHRGEGADERCAVAALQSKSEEVASGRRFVVDEVRWAPLIRADKVEFPVAIRVGNRQAATHHRLAESNGTREIEIASALAANEKRVPIVTAQIR